MAKASAASRTRSAPRAHPHRRSDGVTKRDSANAKPMVAGSVLLKVSNWRQSKAASNRDGGVESLTKFLERRASGYKKSPIRIRKSRVQGDNFIITVSVDDVKPLIMCDGNSFAGSKIKIDHMASSETRNTTSTFSFSDSQKDGESLAPAQITEKFKAILAKRYNPDTLLLDLSALGQDPELNALGINNIVSRPSFFPALMKVCDQTFDTPEKKQAGVVSISLARNNLLKATPIRTLADTFPDLKNLDLSGNKFKNTTSLNVWQNRFPHLEQLLLNDMDLDINHVDQRLTIIRQFPTLQTINGIAIPAEERASATSNKPLPASRPPVFDDQDGIAQNFIRAYFQAFDNDRNILATEAYDDDSTLSIAVNNSTFGSNQPTSVWGAWIPSSRNLHRITEKNARKKRLHRGREAIVKALTALPVTRHPSFDTDADRWLIECRAQSGCPDPNNIKSVGVYGFMITIHGEFDELSGPNGTVMHKRSFDRTLLIGPGGPKGVRIINDMMTVRAYTPPESFKPEQGRASNSPEMDKAKLIEEVQKQTNMTAQYAQMCLEAAEWVVPNALVTFANARATIPPEAFLS